MYFLRPQCFSLLETFGTLEDSEMDGRSNSWIAWASLLFLFELLRSSCALSSGDSMSWSQHHHRHHPSHGASRACVYEDHLITDKNWHGYLSNITIASTGRLTFEFSFPVDKCCPNVLFYSEDQVSTINARMNCWQKEYLLRPEEDQILRLTPKFSWSGCHMTHPKDIATYVCKGGRSFAVEQNPTTWYIAVSNCATLQGLDLTYHMEILGGIGDCTGRTSVSVYNGYVEDPVGAHPPRAAVFLEESGLEPPKPSSTQTVTELLTTCVIEGEVNTTANWHGFIANISLNKDGGFHFRFSYPYAMQVQNVILYNEEDAINLGPDRTCWQKEGVVRSHHVPDQIIDLSFRSSWNGCEKFSNNSTTGVNLTCQGQRHYDAPRKFNVAVNNCRSTSGLLLSYRFDVYGYNTDEMCLMTSAAESPISDLRGMLASVDFILLQLTTVSLLHYMKMIQ